MEEAPPPPPPPPLLGLEIRCEEETTAEVLLLAVAIGEAGTTDAIRVVMPTLELALAPLAGEDAGADGVALGDLDITPPPPPPMGVADGLDEEGV